MFIHHMFAVVEYRDRRVERQRCFHEAFFRRSATLSDFVPYKFVPLNTIVDIRDAKWFIYILNASLP